MDRGGDDGSGGGCKRVILGMARGMKGMMLAMVGGMFEPLAGVPSLYRGRIFQAYQTLIHPRSVRADSIELDADRRNS